MSQRRKRPFSVEEDASENDNAADTGRGSSTSTDHQDADDFSVIWGNPPEMGFAHQPKIVLPSYNLGVTEDATGQELCQALRRVYHLPVEAPIVLSVGVLGNRPLDDEERVRWVLSLGNRDIVWRQMPFSFLVSEIGAGRPMLRYIHEDMALTFKSLDVHLRARYKVHENTRLWLYVQNDSLGTKFYFHLADYANVAIAHLVTGPGVIMRFKRQHT